MLKSLKVNLPEIGITNTDAIFVNRCCAYQQIPQEWLTNLSLINKEGKVIDNVFIRTTTLRDGSNGEWLLNFELNTPSGEFYQFENVVIIDGKNGCHYLMDSTTFLFKNFFAVQATNSNAGISFYKDPFSKIKRLNVVYGDIQLGDLTELVRLVSEEEHDEVANLLEDAILRYLPCIGEDEECRRMLFGKVECKKLDKDTTEYLKPALVNNNTFFSPFGDDNQDELPNGICYYPVKDRMLRNDVVFYDGKDWWYLSDGFDIVRKLIDALRQLHAE